MSPTSILQCASDGVNGVAAALTMYQRARKLTTTMGAASTFVELAELQLEAYVVAMNSLALVDMKNQWITLPITAETGHEVSGLLPRTGKSTDSLTSHGQPRKRRKLSRHIPEDKYSSGRRDSEVVELKDMQYEYALLSARVELVQRDPTLLSAGGEFLPDLAHPRPRLVHRRPRPDFALPPASLVLRLAQAGRFNTAMTAARSLDVDMSDLFGHLTTRCIRLSRAPDSVM